MGVKPHWHWSIHIPPDSLCLFSHSCLICRLLSLPVKVPTIHFITQGSPLPLPLNCLRRGRVPPSLPLHYKTSSIKAVCCQSLRWGLTKLINRGNDKEIQKSSKGIILVYNSWVSFWVFISPGLLIYPLGWQTSQTFTFLRLFSPCAHFKDTVGVEQ